MHWGLYSREGITMNGQKKTDAKNTQKYQINVHVKLSEKELKKSTKRLF